MSFVAAKILRTSSFNGKKSGSYKKSLFQISIEHLNIFFWCSKADFRKNLAKYACLSQRNRYLWMWENCASWTQTYYAFFLYKQNETGISLECCLRFSEILGSKLVNISIICHKKIEMCRKTAYFISRRCYLNLKSC